MILSLWHYLQGYVIVEVSGPQVAKLLNLATYHNLTLWQVKHQEEGVRFCISIKDFKAMRQDVRKARCHVRIVGKKGLPFIANRYRKRKLFVVGIGMFMMLLWFLTSFVWLIEVEGNTRINPLDVVQTLSDNGYATGKLKTKMDLRQAETLLLKNYPDLIWVGIDYEGTRMVVRVAESVLPPNMQPMQGKPTALLAKRDALITYIAVEKGKPSVKVGDIVKKGDMLVAGEMPLGEEDETSYFTSSKAEVKGKTIYTATKEMPFVITKKHYTKQASKSYTFKCFNKSFPFYTQKPLTGNYDTAHTLHQLKITKLFPLPFAIEVTTQMGYQAESYTLTEDEVKDYLLSALWQDVKGSLDQEATILQRQATFKQEGDKIIGSLYVVAEEHIAYEVELDENMLNKGENPDEQN